MRYRSLLWFLAPGTLVLAACHHRSANEDSDAINAGVEDLNNTSDEAVADTDAALAAASNGSDAAINLAGGAPSAANGADDALGR